MCSDIYRVYNAQGHQESTNYKPHPLTHTYTYSGINGHLGMMPTDTGIPSMIIKVCPIAVSGYKEIEAVSDQGKPTAMPCTPTNISWVTSKGSFTSHYYGVEVN